MKAETLGAILLTPAGCHAISSFQLITMIQPPPNNLESQSQQRKIVSPKSTGPEILPMVQETKLKSLIESAEAERRDLLAEVKEHRIKAREEPFSAQRKETATEKTTQMFFSLKETLTVVLLLRLSPPSLNIGIGIHVPVYGRENWVEKMEEHGLVVKSCDMSKLWQWLITGSEFMIKSEALR
ncbi:hypothetical protein OCU04_001126 [Sclerotinia nivalis]|uniref:Uncharacterized protein n=1 Tax=Sclerotinia nivalis TaxID=352851 RepID=A0A9X0AXH4_9HELO|nr:hypothetical protein OCU04_001126 [Sclerotinia nivalis]